jgi:DNA polymerase-3 subunit gamma/tau
MSYQVLARKWRPKRFGEMVGQQHVLKALENALNQNRLHHAYLFTGTRGVGKTTIARIFAKCLNCESGISAEPCGSCSICTAVDEGRFLDLMEIDAASHTGVDSIRELLDNTQYTPTQGRYKVYLIDEVHMLSGSSFNALLKTLEEPPEHVKFLLATTDPQKLPVTVLSRCLQFNLKAMSANQVFEHLKELLEKEMISFEDEALQLIAQAADGSMRDALSLTDQAIAHGNEKLLPDEVRLMLGMVDKAYVTQIVEALLSKNANQLLDCVEQISMDSPNYQAILAELLSFLHRLVIEQVSNADSDPKVKELAGNFTAEDLQLYYQIALKGRQDLAMSPDQKQGLEMALLRMLLFQPEKVFSPSEGGAKVASMPGANASSAQGQSGNVGKAGFDTLRESMQQGDTHKTGEQKKKSELAQVNRKPAQENKKQIQEDKKQTEPQGQVHQSSAQQTQIESKQIESPANQEQTELSQRFSYESIPDKWTQIFLKLNISGPAQVVAKNGNLNKVGGKHFELCFDKKFEMLATEQAKKNITEALSDYFGAELKLDFVLGKTASPTPEQLCQALDLEKSKYAEQSILDDEAVKALLEEFGAQIQEGSAKLIN